MIRGTGEGTGVGVGGHIYRVRGIPSPEGLPSSGHGKEQGGGDRDRGGGWG